MNVPNELELFLSDCSNTTANYLKSNAFNVHNYEVKPISESVNKFMSEHFIIKIKYKSQDLIQEVSFFAKRFPYEYCYVKDQLFLLKDLSVQGYASPYVQYEMTSNEIEKVLEGLAKYHCESIGYQDLRSKQLNRQYCLIEDYGQYMQEPLFTRNETSLGYQWCKSRLSELNALIDHSPDLWDIPVQQFKRELKSLAERSFATIKPNEKFYNVLSDGGMRAKSLMLHCEENTVVDCKLLDFQLQRYCPPAQDVLQFLYLTMCAEMRKRHLHVLLRYYHECLRREVLQLNIVLNDIISYSDFEVSVNYLLPQIKLQTAYYTVFYRARSDFHKNVSSNPKEFKKREFEGDAEFVVESFKTDSTYRKMVIESIIELKYLLTHPKITREDCYKIAEKVLGTVEYDLVNYRVQNLSNLSGFFCVYYSLQMNINLNNENKIVNLFAKCAPEDKLQYDLLSDAKGYEKEGFIYETLIPSIEKTGFKQIVECIPDYYLFRMKEVLVLQDLTASGFCAPKNRVPYTMDELILIVKKVAIFHAGSIILEEKMCKSNNDMFRLNSFNIAVDERFFGVNKHSKCSLNLQNAIEAVSYQMDLFSDIDFSTESLKTRINSAFKALYDLVKPSEVYRNVVCHGDLWASNIMIKYENGNPIDCRFVDYQMIRYCPPAHDLLTLLYMTTTRSVRLECMQSLIDIYYKRFAEILSKFDCNVNGIYSYADFMSSCKYMLPQAVCHAVIFYHLIIIDPELMKDYLENNKDIPDPLTTHRKHVIHYMCERDPTYKSRMRESLLDLKEMCLNYF